MASNEPRIEKTAVPVATLRDQASTGLYFEYTYAMAAVEPDQAQVLYRNVSLFAVHKHLLMKCSEGTMTLQGTKPAKFVPTNVHQNFRTDDKSGLGRELTPAEAFLTVMHAWEWATKRPKAARVQLPAPDPLSDPEYVTVGAHALINEPLLIPVSTKETVALHKGDLALARKLARSAETIWATTISEAPHDDDEANPTPAHRIPRVDLEGIAADSIFGAMGGELIRDVPTAYPEYKELPSDGPTSTLPDLLVHSATGLAQWS